MLNPNKINEIVNASTEDKLKLLHEIVSAPSLEVDYSSLYRELMADPCPEVRRMCLSGFWDNGGDEDLEAIMEIGQNDPDASVRAEACSTLGIYVYDGVVLEEISPERYAALRSYLIARFHDESEDIEVRRFALESLGFDGEDDVTEMLEWAYAQPDLPWQASAVFAMGRSGAARWVPYIVRSLDSEHRVVKLAAVKAASEGYCEEATAKLRNLALSADRDLALEAIWALGRAGGPGAMETLEMCSQSGDEDVREMAKGAIEEYLMFVQAEEEGLDWEVEDGGDDFEEEWDDDALDQDEHSNDDSEDFPELGRP